MHMRIYRARNAQTCSRFIKFKGQALSKRPPMCASLYSYIVVANVECADCACLQTRVGFVV